MMVVNVIIFILYIYLLSWKRSKILMKLVNIKIFFDNKSAHKTTYMSGLNVSRGRGNLKIDFMETKSVVRLNVCGPK